MLEKLKQKLGTGGKKRGGSKWSSNAALSFDLLYQLSYMSVIASSGVPRKQVFERSAELSCATAEYFRKVELMSRRLRLDYAQACRMVGETAKEDEIRGLLLRFSSSLVSGEPEVDFLAREAATQASAFENEYGRKVEALKMWTDAYVSLSLSAALVIIIGMVSTMIWEIETSFVLGLVSVAILITAMGVWLIYLMSPREFVIFHGRGSKEQILTRQVFKMILPVAIAVCAGLFIKGISPGWMLVAAAVLIFPVGWLSNKDDKKVSRRDAEVGLILGSLGGVCAAIGTTVKEALGRIDLGSIDFLRKEVKRLHTRLHSGISSRLCWQTFVEETGSELVNRSVGMFYDAIDLGGDPHQAGYHVSLFASRTAMLRAKRKTVSSPFRWLCVAMHASLVVLLIFITEVMSIFGEMLYKSTQQMPDFAGSGSVSSFTSFNFAGLELMHGVLMPLVLVFTVSDALAPSIADGGSRYKLLYNLGISAFITGVSLLAMPPVADMLFNTAKL
jgi:archaeal flagellar protein FlaJ